MLGLGLGFGKLSSYKYTVKKLIDDYIKRVTAAGGYLEGNECATAKVRELNSQRLLDDASWLLIPEGIKEDVVYTQKPTSGLGDLTFTRASDATYTDSTGVVRRSPYNLLTYSEQFDNAAWTKQTSTITANATTAPNGTLTSDKLIAQIGGGSAVQHRIDQTTVSAAGSKTFSVYAKKEEIEFIFLRIGLSYAWFNLNDGSVSNVSADIVASSVDAGSGWYRLIITKASAVANEIVRINLSTGSGLFDFIGNGTDGAFLWGAQFVEGTEALDYFPTTNRQDVPRIDFRNADGTLSTCGRLLLEPQRTNSIRNSTMVGAVAGSPGTLPTNWTTVVSSGGLTRTIVAVGVESGLNYVDIKLSGTATSALTSIGFDTVSTAAAVGQVWTNSFYVKNIQTTAQADTVSIAFYEYNSSGVYVTEGTTNIKSQITSNLNRNSFTRTLTGATTAFVQGAIRFGLTVGATYDFTIRIAAPQMELGGYATTFIPTTTAAVTRLVDTFSRSNVFTNGYISTSGGTWLVDLSSNLSLLRDAGSAGIFLSETGDGTTNSLNIRSGGFGRLNISKYVGGSIAQLFVTTTDNIKVVFKWNGATADVFVNGVKVVSSTAFTTTQLQFLTHSPTGDVPKYINQSALFPTPLMEAQLVDLTGGRIYYNPVEAYYAYYLTPEIPSAVINSVNSFF